MYYGFGNLQVLFVCRSPVRFHLPVAFCNRDPTLCLMPMWIQKAGMQSIASACMVRWLFTADSGVGTFCRAFRVRCPAQWVMACPS